MIAQRYLIDEVKGLSTIFEISHVNVLWQVHQKTFKNIIVRYCGHC
jgi:tRNA (Thr-GGU) A37 N-methylase